MELSDSQYIQLTIALGLGLALFIAAYAASEKSVVSLLVLSVPFQPISSAYGTLNTVLIYMAAAIFMVRGRLRRMPLLWVVAFIFLTMLLSTSQAHKSTYLDHFFYMVTLFANFLLFYMVYNYFIKSGTNARYALNLFLVAGVVVLFFSVIKLVFKFDPGATFGIDELAVAQNQEDLQRFVSVFQAAGVNGQYHGLQLLIIAFAFIFYKQPGIRVLLVLLFFGNSAFLIATGSRGSFLSTMIGFVLFFIVFARQIGMGRIVSMAVILPILFISAALIMIKYTDYDVLFERLVNTEFTGFTPDSRDFSYALERIPDRMVLGHGPRLRLHNESLRRIPGYESMHYPHNVYLHILFTVGALGLIAYLTWFLGLTSRYLRALRYSRFAPEHAGFARLALVLMAVFLIDEYKIEFLRFGLSDFQQYMFALWAMLLAISDRASAEGREQMQLYRAEQLDRPVEE